MEPRKQQRLTVWKRSDVPCCNCPCLGYTHTHCLCERCRGRAVSHATEFHHWSTATRESEMFAEGQNSDNTADEQIDRVPTPVSTSPSPPPNVLTGGSGSSTITMPPAVTPKDAITSDVMWSAGEALQFVEDTNASQHNFQHGYGKEHLSHCMQNF